MRRDYNKWKTANTNLRILRTDPVIDYIEPKDIFCTLCAESNRVFELCHRYRNLFKYVKLKTENDGSMSGEMSCVI